MIYAVVFGANAPRHRSFSFSEFSELPSAYYDGSDHCSASADPKAPVLGMKPHLLRTARVTSLVL